jgi:hypothetical protein
MIARRLTRAVICAALAAFLGSALLALFYGFRSTLTIEFDRELPRLVGGIYPPERDDASGLTFAWSGREAVLRLRGLDRRAEWIVDARVRGARPDPAQNPALEFYVDGVLLETRQPGVDFAHLTVTIPARLDRSGAVIALRASRTLVPGPADLRELGVMFDRLTLTPAAVVFPPRSTMGAVAVAAAAFGAALALIGFSVTASVGGAVGIAAGISTAVATGFAPYSGLPSVAMTLALWAGAVTVAIIWVVEWWSGASLRNTARFAVVFSVCAAFLKLLMLLHPNMPIGDALFHAHRYRTVVEGNLFFTSIAPGNYQFPYAPGLYVAATPFAAMVSREMGDMTLLRIFAAVTDGVAGAFLYLMIVRVWGDRLSAAVAVGLYHLAPLGFGVARTGNLTNAFAQSVAVLALVLIAHPALRWERRLPLVALTVLLAAAFMSHTSTFAIVFPACVLIAGGFLWKGGPALRSPAAAVAVAALVAVIASIALYYAHFGETYRAEFTRISAETASRAPDAGGRTTMDRLGDVPRYLRLYFDVPLILLAAVGTWRLYVRGARDRATLAVLGWTVTCMLFFVIGIVTPVDMRYYLAAIPAFAVAGGAGASWLWTAGTPHRFAAIGLLGWAAGTGAVNIFRL